MHLPHIRPTYMRTLMRIVNTLASCFVQVAAGSLVLKDVPPKTMVAGSPARPLGKVTGGHWIHQHPEW